MSTPVHITKFLAGSQSQWGPKVSLTLDDGLTLSKDATEEDIKVIVRKVFSYKHQLDQYRTIIDRFLGQLICEYAARTGKTWAESISDLNLAGPGSITGLNYRVVEKLPRMVSRNLPESFTLPGLKTGHFDAISSFSEPEDPARKSEWRDRCHQILEQAAEKPAERGRGWVCENMRELQKEFGIAPKRPEAVTRLLPKVAEVAQMLSDWTEADFAELEALKGIERGQIRDWLDAQYHDLSERGVIKPVTPEDFVPPWFNPSAPTIENENTEENGDHSPEEDAGDGEALLQPGARDKAGSDSQEAGALDGGDVEAGGHQ